ncbi:hypothetical protein IHV25_00670 [Phaeovibrio sulfidiphilus]|uniref:histidine kinase n=2 Tax=Phaeovibrio sulfidiphilus TaxID=1220600 RepID=A0A8J6YH34_9PROT|nr:hypothetical protein [Phaeovibrio sulfidiphilus]
MPEAGWGILPREALHVVPLRDLPGVYPPPDHAESELLRRAVREATGRSSGANLFPGGPRTRQNEGNQVTLGEEIPHLNLRITRSGELALEFQVPWGPFSSIDAPEARTPIDFQPPPPPSDAGWLFGPFGPFGTSEPLYSPDPHDLADGGASYSAVRLVAINLPGGFSLLVGRDLEPIISLRTRMARAIKFGLLIMMGLGLMGGIMMSQRVARRVESINRTSRQIMAGDLSRRVPEGLGPEGDDFDLLAVNLNTMLSRIEALMAGVRHVSDTIAHDLRTPLARLRNRLEALRDHTGSAYCRDEIVLALAEIDGLLSTFNALLRIAQIETGGRRMAFAPVDLVPVLEDVSELYEALAAERSITLHVTLPRSAPLDGDKDLLFQAFANLLDNAVKYSPEGGDIHVALTRLPGGRILGSRYRITIDDQGPGIPAADRGRVFERFARLDEARATPGSGLGLTMVAAVVDAHCGKISLEDAPGGGGLRVVVELMGCATADDDRDPDGEKPAHRGSGKDKRRKRAKGAEAAGKGPDAPDAATAGPAATGQAAGQATGGQAEPSAAPATGTGGAAGPSPDESDSPETVSSPAAHTSTATPRPAEAHSSPAAASSADSASPAGHPATDGPEPPAPPGHSGPDAPASPGQASSGPASPASPSSETVSPGPASSGPAPSEPASPDPRAPGSRSPS